MTSSQLEFTGIQMNIDVESAPHRDANNLGPSTIQAFGSYRGGRLWVEECSEAARSAFSFLPREASLTTMNKDVNTNARPRDSQPGLDVREWPWRTFAMHHFTLVVSARAAATPCRKSYST